MMFFLHHDQHKLLNEQTNLVKVSVHMELFLRANFISVDISFVANEYHIYWSGSLSWRMDSPSLGFIMKIINIY